MRLIDRLRCQNKAAQKYTAIALEFAQWGKRALRNGDYELSVVYLDIANKTSAKAENITLRVDRAIDRIESRRYKVKWRRWTKRVFEN